MSGWRPILELAILPMAWMLIVYCLDDGSQRRGIPVAGGAQSTLPRGSVFPVQLHPDIIARFLRDLAVLVHGAAVAIRISLFMLPVYVGWKLVVSLAGPPDQWIRTAREPQVKIGGDKPTAGSGKVPREA